MQSTKGWLRFIAVFVVLALFMVACGEGSVDTTTSTTAAPTATTAAAPQETTTTTEPPPGTVTTLSGLVVDNDLQFTVTL